jgi:hypothetical protein
MIRCLTALLFVTQAMGAVPYLPPGVKPLPSSAPKGRGPLALVNLTHRVLGHAWIHGGAQPDLFVAGFGGPKAVHLFKWVDTAETGAPVFAEPVVVNCPFTDDGTVFQTKDGAAHGLWIDKTSLVHTLFDREKLEFRVVERLKLDKALKSPPWVAALGNADGSYDLVFETYDSDNPDGPVGSAWTEEWRPFNSSGIAVGEPRYHYLSGARIPSLLKGPMTEVKQISATKKEVYLVMHGITPVNLGRGRERDIVTGSRQGILNYYRNAAAPGFHLEKRRLISGEDGNALRHPSINPSVSAYPNAKDGTSDIIACGEGALYFYRFTGKFTQAGAPIYADPVPVLQEGADLYAGTLPTPTTIDWNGDGVVDILAGNSEGFILFFENIGSNDAPRLLPGTRVTAGGREIQVQAGYAGSLQGLQESRWGYLSPNVIDWNGDSLPDIITGDITGDYMIYLNRGTAKEPKLDVAHPLYCDGLDLHGMWRVRPAVAKIGDRMAIVLVDGDDHFHLYWRIDDYNVEDGGKLLLEDGKPIGASGGPGGMSGRCKLDLFDWNKDGNLDFLIGTNRVNAIPDRENGYPMYALGKNPVIRKGVIGSLVDSVLPAKLKRTIGTPLLMLNKGTNVAMKFARPVVFTDDSGTLIQPGGAHETGAVGTMLGGNGPNLLICNEAGRLFLIPRGKLSTSTAP